MKPIHVNKNLGIFFIGSIFPGLLRCEKGAPEDGGDPRNGNPC